MKRTLTLTTAISALMLSAAVAQTPNTDAKTAPATPAPAAAQSGSANFVASQQPDQWLASKFKGTDVIGTDDKKIGDVSDILFDKDGKILAYVVSVGGFLGVGAKEVALPPSAFTVKPASNGKSDQLQLAMNKDELKQAQNFTPYSPPAPTTTGMGSPAGRGGAIRPLGQPPATGH
jgi:hypothetical protein